MKIAKRSNLVYGRQDDTKYKTDVDFDLKNLFLAMQGRVRFGDGTVGENISGQFKDITSHASANTEFSVAHTLGVIPVGFLVVYQDKAGSLYQAPTTGTAWDKTTVYLKSDVSSLSARIFILK